MINPVGIDEEEEEVYDPMSDPFVAKTVIAYRDVFSSGSGVIVLVDLEKSYGKRSSHTPGDPYQTAFKEGERNVYLKILAAIELGKTASSKHEVEVGRTVKEIQVVT